MTRPDAPQLQDQAEWEARRSGIVTTRAGDTRDAYERDRARVIHSASFRRLQAKTQVLGVTEGDFHRTRLTHSMEVAQIARGIVLAAGGLLPENHPARLAMPRLRLIETICYLHDFGHPPFGHGGERALNYAMRGRGGFEGNGQTLRLAARLEAAYPTHGLDLTRRTLLGVLKYPAGFEDTAAPAQKSTNETWKKFDRETWKPPKCYLDTEQSLVEWILAPFDASDRAAFVLTTRKDPEGPAKTNEKALDTSIMEIADDIAYGVHDLEDSIALHLLDQGQLSPLWEKFDPAWAIAHGLPPTMEEIVEELYSDKRGSRKQMIGSLVHALVTSTQVCSKDHFSHPLLRFRIRLAKPAREFLDTLQAVVIDQVVSSPSVQTLEFRGQNMIAELFNALISAPGRLMGGEFRDRALASPPTEPLERVVCDFIAGMTDAYATRMYQRLFIPGHGTVHERL